MRSTATMLLGMLLAGITVSGADGDDPIPATTRAKVQPAPTAGPDKPSASTNRTEKPRISHEWKMEELLPAVANLAGGRDFKQGNEVFSQAACGTCHALGRISQGNGFSPDLTGVGSKYTRDIILESILQPSAVINGQYYTTLFRLKNGEVEQGTLVDIDAPHCYDYREWFTRVAQQPRVAGNDQPLSQIRKVVLETLTEAEKSDPELAPILGAYREPARGGFRGRGSGAGRGPGPGQGPEGRPQHEPKNGSYFQQKVTEETERK